MAAVSWQACRYRQEHWSREECPNSARGKGTGARYGRNPAPGPTSRPADPRPAVPNGVFPLVTTSSGVDAGATAGTAVPLAELDARAAGYATATYTAGVQELAITRWTAPQDHAGVRRRSRHLGGQPHRVARAGGRQCPTRSLSSDLAAQWDVEAHRLTHAWGSNRASAGTQRLDRTAGTKHPSRVLPSMAAAQAGDPVVTDAVAWPVSRETGQLEQIKPRTPGPAFPVGEELREV